MLNTKVTLERKKSQDHSFTLQKAKNNDVSTNIGGNIDTMGDDELGNIDKPSISCHKLFEIEMSMRMDPLSNQLDIVHTLVNSHLNKMDEKRDALIAMLGDLHTTHGQPIDRSTS